MKRLIVTADDFGMSPGINRGIVQAHRGGILTSASLLVNRPASEEAAAAGRACPGLSVGLHLELDPDDRRGLAIALDSQLVRFEQIVGSPPTHVDSHHDVHHDARVLPYVREWAGRTSLPVRGHSPVRQLRGFYGQWGGDTHLEQISVDGLLSLLDAEVRDGVTELTCHPGYLEPRFSSSYAQEREVELRTLCDPRSRRGVKERDIRLIGFRDLQTLAAHPA